jgi:hypothetical protein
VFFGSSSSSSSISGAFFLEQMGEWERQRVGLLSLFLFLFLFFVFVVVAL